MSGRRFMDDPEEETLFDDSEEPVFRNDDDSGNDDCDCEHLSFKLVPDHICKSGGGENCRCFSYRFKVIDTKSDVKFVEEKSNCKFIEGPPSTWVFKTEDEELTLTEKETYGFIPKKEIIKRVFKYLDAVSNSSTKECRIVQASALFNFMINTSWANKFWMNTRFIETVRRKIIEFASDENLGKEKAINHYCGLFPGLFVNGIEDQ